jgi:DNA-binding response OmpR family regulator
MSKKSKTAISTESSSILIVDDERVLAKTLAHFLQRQGCRTHICHTAKDAISTLATDPFDVVLADFELPDSQGLDLLRHIRKTLSTSRIVVLTAHPSTEAIEVATKKLKAKYLQKPFELEDLMAAIFAD